MTEAGPHVQTSAAAIPMNDEILSTYTARQLFNSLKRSQQSALLPHQVREILTQYPDAVKERNWRGWNVLHWAALHGAPFETLELLVELFPLGLREKTNDDMGLLPLHVAAQHGTPEVVQLFAYSAKAFRAKTTDGCTVLHHACQGRKVNLIPYITAKWSGALEVPNDEGYLPLHVAIQAKAPLPTIRFLVNERPRTVQAMTKVVVDRAEETTDGSRGVGSGRVGLLPLHIAVRTSAYPTIQFLARKYPAALLIPEQDGLLPVHVAAQRDEVPTMLLADMAPAALEVPDANGRLALHLAVEHCDLSTVQRLVNKSPRTVEVADSLGWLALHVASHFGDVEKVKWLANAFPAALRIPTNDGLLPLHIAAQFLHVETVAWLFFQYPPAIGIKCHDGLLPVHWAARYSTVDTVRFLARMTQSTLKEIDNEGFSPLHLASFQESVEIVQCLAELYPPALLVASKDGSLPLHCAASGDSIDVVRYLAEKEPKALLEKDATGLIPLLWAAQSDKSSLDVVYALATICPESIQLPSPLIR